METHMTDILERQVRLSEMDTRELEVSAVANLSPQTRRTYAALWRAHIRPRLGDEGLRELRPDAVERFRDELAVSGVPPATVRAAVVLLRSVFGGGAAAGPIAGLPAEGAEGGGDDVPRPIEPSEIERLRAALAPRDAVIVSLLAYAGLRPGELLALRWSDVGRGRIHVDSRRQIVRRGTSVNTVREVRLLNALASDLAAWKTTGGVASDDELVIPGPEGEPWNDAAWVEWRRHRFFPAADAAGFPKGVRPYELRHTFAWLLLREGTSMVDLALETGYSPLTALRLYRGLAERAETAGHRLAPEAIAVARVA
jgi:integrase